MRHEGTQKLRGQLLSCPAARTANMRYMLKTASAVVPDPESHLLNRATCRLQVSTGYSLDQIMRMPFLWTMDRPYTGEPTRDAL
jgi:hypothetical protein